MSDIAKQMFDSLKQGLNRFGTEVSAELTRQAEHGSSEIASVFHTGNAFVQYAPRQGMTSHIGATCVRTCAGHAYGAHRRSSSTS